MPQVLCTLNDDPSAGHLGVSKTLEKERGGFIGKHAGGFRESL